MARPAESSNDTSSLLQASREHGSTSNLKQQHGMPIIAAPWLELVHPPATPLDDKGMAKFHPGKATQIWSLFPQVGPAQDIECPLGWTLSDEQLRLVEGLAKGPNVLQLECRVLLEFCYLPRRLEKDARQWCMLPKPWGCLKNNLNLP